METRDKILEIIKMKGPVPPSQISKEIGSDILMASAHLAELTASNKLKISSLKVGFSPVYYLPGQESMLQKFTSSMNDKEKKAYDLLQLSKILRDVEQEPVIRVALREIKDFAMPLNVNFNNNKEIFWKWYLMSNDEAELIIKSKLGIEKKEDVKAELPKLEPKKVEQELLKESIEKAPKKTRERKYKPREIEDHFLISITKFFEKSKINIVSSEIIKKNSEMDFIVEIPTVVGNLQYYCKAKNKKRISDSDLSNAFVKGQLRRMPVIVISEGDLSSKAEELLKKEFSNMTFKKI